MGAFSAPLLIVIQSSVDWQRRGVATALNQFSRTIGGAVGVALMGVVLERYVSAAGAPLAAREQLRAGLQTDFGILVVLALAVLGAGVVLLITSRRQAVEQAPRDAAMA
jgi:Na+/melibiose symporter-like transporter